MINRLVTLFFFILVSVLLFLLVKNLDWQDVSHALLAYKGTTLALGGAVALASYAVYVGFDLLGRRYTGHQLPVRQVVPVEPSTWPDSSVTVESRPEMACAASLRFSM